MGQLNELFNNEFLNRNSELATRTKLTFNNVRPKAIINYTVLLDCLKAFDNLFPNTDYWQILKQIDTIFINFNGDFPKPQK